MSEDIGIVTRFSDPARFSPDGQVVDTRAIRAEIEDTPFYEFNPDEQPSDAAQAIWESYKERSAVSPSLRAYAKCLRLGEDGTDITPHLQVFVGDVLLGNLNREGFLRQIVNPDLPEEENLKRIKGRVKELKRYSSSGVISVRGYFMERPMEERVT